MTECIFGEDVVENAVGHELECVVTRAGSGLGIQHLELSLTLVELLVVALLQSNASMRLVHNYRQLVPDTLYLYTALHQQRHLMHSDNASHLQYKQLTYTLRCLKKVKRVFSSLCKTHLICHMVSHSVTCHPTQVNVHHFNPSQAGRYSFYLPPEGWKAELTLVLVIYRDGLSVRRQSPIPVITTWWWPDQESNCYVQHPVMLLISKAPKEHWLLPTISATLDN